MNGTSAAKRADIGPFTNNNSKASPRNLDVEKVNQKIDNAKRKMSRYFAARNNI